MSHDVEMLKLKDEIRALSVPDLLRLAAGLVEASKDRLARTVAHMAMMKMQEKELAALRKKMDLDL